MSPPEDWPGCLLDHLSDLPWPGRAVPGWASFDVSARAAVFLGIDESELHAHGYVGSQHLFLGVWRSQPETLQGLASICSLERLAEDTMRHSNRDPLPDEVLRRADALRRQRSPVAVATVIRRAYAAQPPVFTPRGLRHLRRAAALAVSSGRPASGEDLAIAVLEDPGSVVYRGLLAQEVDPGRIDQWVATQVEWGGVLRLIAEERSVSGGGGAEGGKLRP